MLSLAHKSLWYRRGTAFLTVLCIALSVMMLLAVERVRTQARESFGTTVSGTDLIVGARGNPVQILLSSVFHIGYPTNNVSWATYQEWAANPEVAWTIPLSVGDSHKNARVIGTTPNLFAHFQYGTKKRLEFAAGSPFSEKFDTVLGSDVAQRLNYTIGSKIVVAHGAGEVSFVEHADTPFTVTGVLKRTGTPIDRAIFVSLDGYEGMHAHFAGEKASEKNEDPLAAASQDHDHEHEGEATEGKAISSFLVGLKSRQAALGLQRSMNDYKGEALSAVLPGVALQELWEVTRTAESALVIVSMCVVIVGLVGMLTTLLAGLNERRREMAVLRSVGARPGQIFGLLVGEAFLLSLGGAILGVAFLYGLIAVVRPMVSAQYGIELGLGLPTEGELGRLSVVLLAGLAVGILPAYRTYRTSLVDGLSIRI